LWFAAPIILIVLIVLIFGLRMRKK
jgi:hypothetical protein